MVLLTICLAVMMDFTIPVKQMTASWYGEGFHGRTMANGETFNRHNKTVAHRDLPFGTEVKIINPNNGKMIEAVVTDRGPFVLGRELDVSEVIAKKLGFHQTGTATLLVAIKNN